MLTGNRQPDHSRISEFHRSNLEAPSGLFVQILRFCQEAGMVSLDHVALDDIKVQDKRQRGRPSNQPGSRALGQGQLKVSHKVTSLAQIVVQDCDLDQLICNGKSLRGSASQGEGADGASRFVAQVTRAD